MKIQPSTVGWATLCGALAVALAFSSCHDRPDAGGKIPAPTQKTVDSLEATRPSFDDRRDSVEKLVVVDTARAARAERLAKAAKLEAESFRRAADSLAAVARAQGDSSFLWKLAYDNRTNEADQLRTSVDSAESALQSERSARLRLFQLAAETEARRREAEEVVIPSLKNAIGRLEKPCRIGPLPCPSRRASFLIGVVAAVGVASAK